MPPRAKPYLAFGVESGCASSGSAFFRSLQDPGLSFCCLRQHPRVLEVAEADVECGQRDPGAVGLGMRARQLALEVGEVARAGERCSARDRGGRDAAVPGGILGQHHHSAHIGLARRLAGPTAIPDTRSRRAAATRCRFAAARDGKWRCMPAARCGSAPERPRRRCARPRGMAEIAIDEPLQRAVTFNPCEETIQILAQRRKSRWNHPRELPLAAGDERNVEVQKDVACDCCDVRRHERVAGCRSSLTCAISESVAGSVERRPADAGVRPVQGSSISESRPVLFWTEATDSPDRSCHDRGA